MGQDLWAQVHRLPILRFRLERPQIHMLPSRLQSPMGEIQPLMREIQPPTHKEEEKMDETRRKEGAPHLLPQQARVAKKKRMYR